MKSLQYKDEKVKALYEHLKEGVQDVVASGKLDELFRFWSRFHKYSFGNILLIYAQKPDATLCAGYKTWQSMGRQVKKGEKGIAILAPKTYKKEVVDEDTGEPITETRLAGFKVVHVFDVSQTDGKPLPGLDANLGNTWTGQRLYDRLVQMAAKLGVAVMTEQIGIAKGYYNHSKNIICLSSAVEGDERVVVLLHELAHAIAHRINENTAHKRRGDEEYIKGEIIAEGAAYIVANYFGIDPGEASFLYIADWAKEPEKILIWGDAVEKVADELIKGVEKVKEKTA